MATPAETEISKYFRFLNNATSRGTLVMACVVFLEKEKSDIDSSFVNALFPTCKPGTARNLHSWHL